MGVRISNCIVPYVALYWVSNSPSLEEGTSVTTARKTLRIPRHSLNAFSEPRPGRILELVEASKS